jgi:glycosyltransferase involved in cell wall biosynthesis
VPTLGWTGSHSTLPFLKLLEKPLQRLAARRRFRLLVISHTEAPDLGWTPPVEVVGKKWNAATEATDLHAIDVGLAPFPDTGWTPWRCHGKVLQYMAAGIPTVASRIGILPEYVRNGGEGFLAATEDEWTERLATLLDDADLRRHMGAAGRETVAEHYSAHVWAPRVRGILESAAATRRH